MNMPIFAITEEGGRKRILKEFENAFITDGRKTNEMAEKFLEMLKAIKSGRIYLEVEEKIGKCDRRYLTEKLARCLEELHKYKHSRPS